MSRWYLPLMIFIACALYDPQATARVFDAVSAFVRSLA